MFKWPQSPSPYASESELADYIELVCWDQRSASMTEISKQLVRLEENDYSDDAQQHFTDPSGEAEDIQIRDPINDKVEAAYVEIEQRKKACGGGYPFREDKSGTVLRAGYSSLSAKHIIYKYLLLATRLNMKDSRCHAGLDGTQLFEQLAAEAGREYLGARAESLVFGTAHGTAKFPQKVKELCEKIGEGGGFVNRAGTSRVRDGKLDVVVWKDFSDNLAGKLIAFGQCKTGTNYKDSITHLQPDAFCKKWLMSFPVHTPIRMFFVSDALARSSWNSSSVDAGLLFDRCRVVDFCDNVNKDVLSRIENWTKAAASACDLPHPISRDSNRPLS